MLGTRQQPSIERIRQRLVWAAERLRQEAERLESCSDQRDHVIATIIANLRKGATPAQILTWWDNEGQQLLKGYDLTLTGQEGENT